MATAYIPYCLEAVLIKLNIYSSNSSVSFDLRNEFQTGSVTMLFEIAIWVHFRHSIESFQCEIFSFQYFSTQVNSPIKFFMLLK